MSEFIRQFLEDLKDTSPLEAIAVVTGVASVWFSRLENILVYPVGLVSTVIYIYLSFTYALPGEAVVNLFYTIMSIYGWSLWARRGKQQHQVLHITFSNRKQVLFHLAFFLGIFFTFFISINLLQSAFDEKVIPFGDSFATATAFTGMLLMAQKKVESWYWWIGTNIASIPLYYVKGLAFSSVYYFILLVFAFWGLKEWKLRARKVVTG